MKGGTDRGSHVRSEAPGRQTETVLASTIKRSGKSGPCAILCIERKVSKEGSTPWPDCRTFKHAWVNTSITTFRQ